jgi:hypothetical protein
VSTLLMKYTGTCLEKCRGTFRRIVWRTEGTRTAAPTDHKHSSELVPCREVSAVQLHIKFLRRSSNALERTLLIVVSAGGGWNNSPFSLAWYVCLRRHCASESFQLFLERSNVEHQRRSRDGILRYFKVGVPRTLTDSLYNQLQPHQGSCPDVIGMILSLLQAFQTLVDVRRNSWRIYSASVGLRGTVRLQHPLVQMKRLITNAEMI